MFKIRWIFWNLLRVSLGLLCLSGSSPRRVILENCQKYLSDCSHWCPSSSPLLEVSVLHFLPPPRLISPFFNYSTNLAMFFLCTLLLLLYLKNYCLRNFLLCLFILYSPSRCLNSFKAASIGSNFVSIIHTPNSHIKFAWRSNRQVVSKHSQMELRDYWKTGSFIWLRDMDLVIREVTCFFRLGGQVECLGWIWGSPIPTVLGVAKVALFLSWVDL